MLIKYHGKLCDITNKLEDGEEELDLFNNDINLENTIEIKREDLEDTIKINPEEIIDFSKDEKDE